MRGYRSLGKMLIHMGYTYQGKDATALRTVYIHKVTKKCIASIDKTWQFIKYSSLAGKWMLDTSHEEKKLIPHIETTDKNFPCICLECINKREKEKIS